MTVAVANGAMKKETMQNTNSTNMNSKKSLLLLLHYTRILASSEEKRKEKKITARGAAEWQPRQHLLCKITGTLYLWGRALCVIHIWILLRSVAQRVCATSIQRSPCCCWRSWGREWGQWWRILSISLCLLSQNQTVSNESMVDFFRNACPVPHTHTRWQ